MNAISQIKSKAIKEGSALLESIDMTTRVLAGMMREVHGGDWRTDIDHDTGFIVIRKRADMGMSRPKRGEIA